MHKPYTRRDALLGLICLVLICGVVVISATAQIGQDPLYNTKIKAYEYMDKCMVAVRSFKTELGLPMTAEDIHKTGMIGQEYSPITTSLGSIEAKRTSANPDMAALVVELLHKAGVKEGNIIGANFSGSFPSLNLAVLSACKAMGVKCIYISSIGSSNYGANYPELTFPDMALILTAKGLIDSPGAAFSVGGSDDIGSEMDQDIISGIVKRLKDNGLPQITAKGYQDDLLLRQQLFESSGDISCFVNVGGNITSLGEGESSFYFGQGLLSNKIVPVTEKSGLIEIYRNRGVPVVHLLNLRKLTADYGMAYDPITLPPKGTSALYVKPSYNRMAAIICIGTALAGLLVYRKIGN